MALGSVDVVDREREFYNEKSDNYRRIRLRIWRAIGEFNRNEELYDLVEPAGKRVLLYGCGPAHEAKALVDAGATHVSGIDISEVEIEEAWRTARAQGIEHQVNFRPADAHATGFADDSFDLIVGSAILHHLDVARALAELRRILAPGGRAVFLEPLLHNPILRLGRKLTPGARTPDEHPFTVEDWRLCAQAFEGFWHREVELTSVPLMPLNLVMPVSWQKRIAVLVRRVDDWLLKRFSVLRRYARSTFIVLE